MNRTAIPVLILLATAVSVPAQVDTIVLIRGNQKTVETFPVETRKHESSK